MLIKLTLAHNRSPFSVRAADVRQVQRDDQNPLVTGVWTGGLRVVNGAQEPAMYGVLESVEEVTRMVNEAWEHMRGLNTDKPLPGERSLIRS